VVLAGAGERGRVRGREAVQEVPCLRRCPIASLARALVLLFLAVPVLARAACPLDPSDLKRSLDDAYSKYTDLDFKGFHGAFDGARDDLHCLSGTLDPGQAAKLHFAYALQALLDRDQDKMLRAARAVLADAPKFRPSPDVARPGNGLYIAFEMARQPRESVTAKLPADGRWVVDGTAGATEVPLDRNTVVQRVDTDPIETFYVDGSKLPPGLAPPAPPPVSARASKHQSRTLLGVGIGVGLAAGASLGAAAHLKDRYFDTQDPPVDPAGVRTWNHVSGISGWALAVGAAGLGAGAVVAWDW